MRTPPKSLNPGVRKYGESFLLINYPHAGRLKVGDSLPGLAALRVTKVSQTASGGTTSYIAYDYGENYVPPQRQLSPQEAAAAKAQAGKRKTDTDAALLKFEQEQSDNGKDLYQYRMGLRYLNGNGVTNNLAKARECFSKAAAQGNPEAAAELRKLSSQ